MARDTYDESKKKKKKQETTQKKAKSPSVSKSVAKTAKEAANTAANTARDTAQKVNRQTGGKSYTAGGNRQRSTADTAARVVQRTARTASRTTRSIGRNLQEDNRSVQAVQPTYATAEEMKQARQAERFGKPRSINNEQSRNNEIGQIVKSQNLRNEQKKTAQGVKSGTHKAEDTAVSRWDKDIADTITHTLKQTASSDKAFVNTAFHGITQKGRDVMFTPEQNREADEKYEKRRDKYTADIEKETKELEELKKGHSYLGKQALSAVSSTTGMMADIAVGTATGTGQVGTLGHMFMRSTGATQGQVKKKAAALREQLEKTGTYSEEELDEMFKNVDVMDELNAIANGGIEVTTELLFPGYGMARRAIGGKGMSIAEKAASALFKKSGAKASSGALKRMLMGTAEEVAEEEIGGPAQAYAANLIYGNKFQEYNEDAVRRSLKAQSDELRNQITSDDDARQVAARLGSSSFLNESKQAYLDSGMSDEQATKLAELSRDYLSASLSGDIDTVKEKQEDMVKALAGEEHSLKEKFTLQDALDAAVSTSMMTMGTGAMGAMKSAHVGKAFKGTAGIEAVRQQAEIIRNWGSSAESDEAQAVMDSIDAGEDVSDTQVYEIIQGAAAAAEKGFKAEETSRTTAAREMKKRDLRISPIQQDGTLAPQTERRYSEIVNSTVSRYDSLAKLGQVSEMDAADIELGAEIGAAMQTGVISAEMVNELAKGSATVKTVFQDVAGIDLERFNKYDRHGNLDIAATNNSMQQALMAEAAHNMVNSARLEQAAWNSEARGAASESIAKTVAKNSNLKKGYASTIEALQSVDPRDRDQFMLMGSAAENVYEYAYNTQDTWDDVKGTYKKMYPSLSMSALKGIYDSAKMDRYEAETPFLNAKVKAGEAMDSLSQGKAKAEVRGKFENTTPLVVGAEGYTGRELTDDEQLVCVSLAEQFNANIFMVDAQDKRLEYTTPEGKQAYSNAVVDLKNGTIYVGNAADIGKIVHEVTHMGARLASDKYLDMAHYIMDKAYKFAPERTKAMVEAYKRTYAGQDLTDAQIEEELVSDLVAVFSDDPIFIREISQEQPSLAKRIYNAICDVLKSLRNILTTGRIQDPAVQESFLEEIGAYEQARQLWLAMMHEAAENNAAIGLAEWEDKAFRDTRESRDAVEEDGFNIKDGNARWTDERIDDLIETYGASNQDYSQAYATLMSPRDFLRLTISNESLRKWRESLENQPEEIKNMPYKEAKKAVWNKMDETGEWLDDENFPLDQEELKRQGQAPFLYIRSYDNQMVAGHEGRHRMRALMEAGITSVPVVIQDPDTTYSKEHLDEMSLVSTDFINIENPFVHLTDLVPIKESNRDELIQKFGGEAQVRFSLDEPVERVKDLIAVHNLKPDDIRNTFNLGGFPMPSIAVTKDSMGHNMYGDITLMFHSDTIDPKKKRTNEVFGGDAYTPVFPRIHYKASSKVEKRLSDLYYEWSQKYGYDTVRPFYEYGQTLQDALDRAGGEAALIDQLKSDSNLMRMYLRINDNDVEDVMKITEITMSEGEVDLSKRLIDALGEEDIRSIVPEGVTGREALQYRREWVEAHKEQLERVYRDYFTSDGVLSEEDIESVIPEIKPGEYAVAVRKALDYLRHGATTTKEEKDYEATTNAIRQAAEETGYEEWVDDLFKGVEEKRGLRNDRDIFTPNGNRRRWESLYEPVTLAGVVRVMSQELSAGANGLLGANPKGASQKSYKSLDEIRADEDRLQQLPEEEFKALEEAAVQKLSDVCVDIVDSNSNVFQGRFGAALDVGEYIAEILNVTKNRASIQRNLQNDYNLKVSDTQMDALMEAIDEIANLPTGYFEAKPRRAVGFDEVKAAIIPAYTDEDIKQGFSDRGIQMYEYDPDVEGDRTEKVNEAADAQDLRFSLTPEQQQRDKDYMEAVISGNMEEAQRLVDEAAKVAGFKPVHRYHGSMNASFTVFDKAYAKVGGNSGAGFYFSTEEDDSVNHYQDVEGADNYFKWSSLAENIWDQVGEGMWEGPELETYEDAVEYAKNELNKTPGTYDVYLNYKNPYVRNGRSSTNIYNSLYENFDESLIDRDDYDTEDEYEDALLDERSDEIYRQIATAVHDAMIDIRDFYEVVDSPAEYDIYNAIADHAFSYEEITWDSILRAVDNAGYAELIRDDWTESGYGATEFTRAIIENFGFDAIEDKEVSSKFGQLSREMMTDTEHIIVFKPEQIKLSDPVTYAEDGSVIPLSERFDPDNNDIRYSLPTQDSDGNVLSDGQMEYFKESQARDPEGKLVPVYHTTNRGGFTIFDPARTEDKRSLFFTDDFAVSQTYGRYASRPIRLDEPEGETQRGYYAVYLNLTNPLIVDAKGARWKGIFYEGGIVSTNDLSKIAQSEGYDGLIVRNCKDIGGESRLQSGSGYSDIYVAFSSNQVKDMRNENPSENPDIRYSKTDPDEAMSRMAHDYAYDTSHELLEYYESIIGDLSDSDTSKAYNKARKMADVDKFYAGLQWYADGMKFDDPVLEEGRERMATSKADFFSRNNAKWNPTWLTEGKVLDDKSVRKPIRELVMSIMQNADTPAKYKTDVVNKTIVDVRLAYNYARQGRTEIADALLWHSSLRMIENVDFIDDEVFNNYKDLRDYLRTTRISLGEEYWADVNYQQFRKDNYNKINLVRGETNVDTIYQEMCELWPEFFKEDEYQTPPEQLARIEQVLDSIKPYRMAYSSEEAAEMAFDIASELFDIMESGTELKSFADKAKERTAEAVAAERARAEERAAVKQEKFDHDVKALKARHMEAMREAKEKVRNAEKEKAKAKFKEYKAEQKEKKYHSKYFKSIKKSYDTLVDRLRTNTKDKHIPEQYKRELAAMLSAFDFQTVRSKKIQTKKGPDGYERVDMSKKTINMLALQSELKKIAADTPLFRVNDAVTDLISELTGMYDGSYREEMNVDGKTLDELNSEQLKKIDKLLKALIHEFNNYENVRIGKKKQKAADIGGAQIESSLAHAEKYGKGSDYYNIRGKIDKLLNMDELTPAYLFRQIDPEGNGLGIMFKELRQSFDKYVRNQAQLSEWMEEIVGEYHQKGKIRKYGSGELEQWRSENRAKQIELESGKIIKLTPAQMMSIHCLARRTQAYNHMVGDGIVIKPVSFQAKLMSDLRKKADYSLPVKLTDTDISNIEQLLTPEQVAVADKLQQLMATKMAEWGNEASMNVIGIKLFEDPDYFPIKSDKAALEKDFTAEQFTEMIRSFGFAKAVAPNAKNAIAIDDIFEVVTEHCNNMNLYNAYSESVNDFMKVYNYKQAGPDSVYSVEQAVAHAYSQKATTFIRTFMADLNGNVSRGRDTGIDQMMNDALGKAKKASVFANGRVALQQPTAIVRAFAVIDPKYLKGVNVVMTKEAMQEMFDRCPIALWKSWGYYDINMGKSIEDLIMNEGSIAEDLMSDIYGKLDNKTWSVIWQMVKNEVRETNPELKENTDEFFDKCNERMTEVVDLTQVVDSPFHRSHAMRDKNTLTKMFTAFMAEPTLTYNVVRDGLIRAVEARKDGNKGNSYKILGKTTALFVAQAATVSAAAAIWDAVRRKKPDKDDEDDSFFNLWWMNCIENFKDNINLFNDIYYAKDVMSIFEGWDQKNLGLQGFVHLRDAYNQLTGNKKVSSKLSWLENALAGIGYLSGVPAKTLINDTNALWEWLGWKPGVVEFAETWTENTQQSMQDMLGGEAAAMGITQKPKTETSTRKESKSENAPATSVKGWTYENAPFQVKDGSLADNILNHFGVNLTASEIKSIEDKEKEAKRQEKVNDIIEKTESLSGEAKDKKVWKYVTTYMKAENGDIPLNEVIQKGDYGKVGEYRAMYTAAGGDPEYFTQRIFETSKTALKKTIHADQTNVEIEQQNRIKDYLLRNGMSEVELSDMAYHSYTARDLKAAIMLNDADAAVTELRALFNAGLTDEDFYRLWDNRKNFKIAAYKVNGKYKDRFKSTGTYKWAVNGTITSYFGGRKSPGGIGSTNHKGIDIAGSTGDPVYASDGGVVVMAKNYGGYGKTVQIQHDDGTITQYSHLSWWDAQVGDVVGQGQVIGKVGSTGNSTGPHLHFGIIKNGSYVNPMKYLK